MGKFVLWSGPPHIKSGPEESAQTFIAGDLLKLDASTSEVEIASDGSDVMGVAIDGDSATSADIKYHMVTPEQVWSVESSGTPAATMVGLMYDIASVATGTSVVDVSSAATDVVLEGLDPRDTAASGSRVLVRFVPGSCDGWGG